MKNYVIVVAGGKGLRMGGELPKQFIPVNGKPILMHTLKVFNDWSPDAEIILALPKGHNDYWSMLCEELKFNIPHKIVFGGETRFHSVKNALQEIKEDGLVAVHDGVRPWVTLKVIADCFLMAQQFGAAIPVVPMIDSVREIINENESQPFQRERLRIVQTPQVFKNNILIKSYEQSYNELFTDDASVVEAAGYKVQLVPGNRENIKITTPTDLLLAKTLASNIGIG
ncbi:MAG: 2-C-methyl-D-erythritol 4-phosphate cytidylyltransferase [Tannerella sp.]|nr:2-C-methyl-D-erythritol 4-phosphate cytidylyltransferase [Tannerella sp.]